MTTPKEAFLRGDFDRGLTLIGFYEKLRSWGLSLLLPHVPHKIFVYSEVIALKSKDGVRLHCWISLDWVKQEFTLSVHDVFEETWKVQLD